MEEKHSICRQTLAPGISVAQAAHCHALNADAIFKWLKGPRSAPFETAADTPLFLSMEIDGQCTLGPGRYRGDDQRPQFNGGGAAFIQSTSGRAERAKVRRRSSVTIAVQFRHATSSWPEIGSPMAISIRFPIILTVS